MAGLNYTCSMPTSRHRTHDAVDRSFYDAIKKKAVKKLYRKPPLFYHGDGRSQLQNCPQVSEELGYSGEGEKRLIADGVVGPTEWVPV